MAEQHTPGPWSDSEGEGFIRSTAVPTAGSRICRVQRNIEANAKLIAAAPEMLEALQRMVRWFEDDRSPWEAQDMCRVADAAIDKATP